MGKIKFFKTAGIVLCSMLLFPSCKMLFSSRKKGLNTMTMTTVKEGEVTISLAGTGMITIDWGDGTPRETELISPLDRDGMLWNYHSTSHNYSGTSARTITITGENITLLGYWNNELTELNVSKNSALTRLGCDNNRLTKLDVSKNLALTGLGCDNNRLTVLDVSKNIALTTLNCGDNRLTKLDVSNNNALTQLFCYGNMLTELDVSGATALTQLQCWNNLLEAPALNALFGTLPNNPTPQTPNPIVIAGNPGTDAACSNTSIPENKGWRVYCNSLIVNIISTINSHFLI